MLVAPRPARQSRPGGALGCVLTENSAQRPRDRRRGSALRRQRPDHADRADDGLSEWRDDHDWKETTFFCDVAFSARENRFRAERNGTKPRYLPNPNTHSRYRTYSLYLWCVGTVHSTRVLLYLAESKPRGVPSAFSPRETRASHGSVRSSTIRKFTPECAQGGRFPRSKGPRRALAENSGV